MPNKKLKGYVEMSILRPVVVIAVVALMLPISLLIGGAAYSGSPSDTSGEYCTGEAAAGTSNAATFDPHTQCFTTASAATGSLGTTPAVLRRAGTEIKIKGNGTTSRRSVSRSLRHSASNQGQSGSGTYCTGEAAFGTSDAATFDPHTQCFTTASAAAGSLGTSWNGHRYIKRPHAAAARLSADPDVETVIGEDYMDTSFQGRSYTWYETADINGCTDGSYYTAASLPSGWNDDVSSAQSYGGCATYNHFENINFGGSRLTCTCSSMGVMNDQTSSEKWYK